LENRDDLQRDGMTPKAPAAPDNVRDCNPPTDVPPGAEAEPSLGQWLASNGFGLLVVAAAIGYVLWNFDAEGIWAICKALIGLSFVIFIHELGHFLVAKWCDVNVTTFSIGFGPAIPGCWFQRGETTYKLSLLPLGGYVQMLGQVDGDEGSDGSEDDPRSYRNKGVGQRMLIISAGVIMNAILACICFIIVYQGRGKDNPAAVINEIDSNSPAQVLGIRTGSKIKQIGSAVDPTFNDLRTQVVYTRQNEKLKFVAQRPEDAEPLRLEIEPRLDKGDPRPVIGVGPAYRLENQRRLMGARIPGPFVPDSPAAQATAASGAIPALQYGDQIIATTDPDDPTKIKDLPGDARNDQKDQKDFFEFQRRMARWAGQDVTLRVLRADGTTRDDVFVKPAHHLTLGIRMQMGQIAAIRKDSPAANAGVQIPRKEKDISFKGDVIIKVVVSDAPGKMIAEFDNNSLDPERLPFLLQQCADKLRQPNGKVDMKVTLHVDRHRTEGGVETEKKELALDWDDGWRFDRIEPLHKGSPLAIPELGLTYQIKPVVAGVRPDLIPGNPLQPNDVIKELIVTHQDGDRQRATTLKLGDNFAHVSYWLYQHPAPLINVTVKIERDKETLSLDVVPVADRAWPLANRGWMFTADTRRKKADNFAEAIWFGLSDTGDNMMQVWQTLKGMFTGRISPDNLGGPLMIAETAYRIAGYDIWEFIFFLGLISINLAVINFLPIPVLDGGHMVFLAYEKLRGKQASEAVRIGATYVGLALILSLMVFVLWLDYKRISQ